jgi:hypothetical protein
VDALAAGTSPPHQLGELAMSSADFLADTPYARLGTYAIDAPVDARRAFIQKTYIHLAAAVYAFVAVEWLLFSLGFDQWFMRTLGNTPYSWLLVLGGFMVVSWVANSWALSATSPAKQYAGLFLYVLVQAVLFVPLIAVALDAAVTIGGIGTVGVLSAAAAGNLVRVGDGDRRLWIHPVLYIECVAPLSYRPTCGGRIGIICLRRTLVLVRVAIVSSESGLNFVTICRLRLYPVARGVRGIQARRLRCRVMVCGNGYKRGSLRSAVFAGYCLLQCV